MSADLSATLRRWHTVAVGYRARPAFAVITAAALLQALGPQTIPVPAILSTVEVTAKLTIVCAWGFAVGLTQLTYEPAAAVAATSARGWPGIRVTRLAVAGVCCGLLTVLTVPAGLASVSLNALLILLAEGLVSARLLGTALSWVLPAAHLVAALVFGYDGIGNVHSWAWILDDHSSVGEVILAAAAATAAVTWWAQQPAAQAADIH